MAVFTLMDDVPLPPPSPGTSNLTSASFMAKVIAVGTSMASTPDATSAERDNLTGSEGDANFGNTIVAIAISGLLVGIILFLWMRARSSGGVGGAKVVRMSRSSKQREHGLIFSRVATHDPDDYSMATQEEEDEEDQEDETKAEMKVDADQFVKDPKPARLLWNITKPAQGASAAAPIPTGVVHVDEEAHMALDKIGASQRANDSQRNGNKRTSGLMEDVDEDDDPPPRAVLSQHQARAERSRPAKLSAQDLD